MAKKSKKGKGFLDLGWVISLILAFFLIGWILGIIERYKRGNTLGAILNALFYGFGILWICDIITLIVRKDIRVLA